MNERITETEVRLIASDGDPKLVYIPSIAPSNMVVYRGDKYPEFGPEGV